MNQEALIRLSQALYEENFEEVKKWFPLVENNTLPNDLQACFPFDLLYSCRSLEIMSFLLDSKVSLNHHLMDMNYQTIIYGQIRSVQKKIVSLLLKNGAKVNVIDGNGDTPLSFAVRNKDRLKLVPLLLEHGANPSLGNNIFSILEKDPQALSAFEEFVKDSFDNMMREDNLNLLEKQIKRFRSLDNIPDSFRDDLEIFECLSGLDERIDSKNEGENEGSASEGSVSEEKVGIINNLQNQYDNMGMVEFQKKLKETVFSEQETHYTEHLTMVHPLEETNHAKGKKKNYSYNQNPKLRPRDEEQRERVKFYCNGF